MENVIINSSLTIDTFEKVINLTQPLLLAKITTALAFVTLFSFFLIRKMFSKKKEKHTWLPIVLPVRKIFTDFYPHVQCIHTIYCDCNREIINKMIMAQEIHRTLIIGPRESTILGQKKHEYYSQKMVSIQAPFLDDALAQIQKRITKIRKKIKRKIHSAVSFFRKFWKYLLLKITITAISMLMTWILKNAFKEYWLFLKGEIPPVRGSPRNIFKKSQSKPGPVLQVFLYLFILPALPTYLDLRFRRF